MSDDDTRLVLVELPGHPTQEQAEALFMEMGLSVGTVFEMEKVFYGGWVYHKEIPRCCILAREESGENIIKGFFHGTDCVLTQQVSESMRATPRLLNLPLAVCDRKTRLTASFPPATGVFNHRMIDWD